MANFPGPGEVRINYSSTTPAGTFLHQHRFSFNNLSTLVPGMDFDTITAEQRDGGSMTVRAFLDAYMPFIEPIFQTGAATFGTAEVWLYTPGTFSAIWIADGPLTFTASGGTANITDAQTIATFRSSLGGRARLDWRDTIYALAIFLLYPTANAVIDDLVEFASSPDTIMVARDGGHFVVPYKFLRGTNEQATKDRLR